MKENNAKVKLTTEEIKKVELSMLEYIDKICNENNIKYSLVGGVINRCNKT